MNIRTQLLVELFLGEYACVDAVRGNPSFVLMVLTLLVVLTLLAVLIVLIVLTVHVVLTQVIALSTDALNCWLKEERQNSFSSR